MANAYVMAKLSGTQNQQNLFGMEPPPPKVLLKREVLRWLQTLDLTHSVRNIRRDAANGFLVAEVCSRYYPSEITMHSFSTGQSNYSKKDNWEQLEKFFKRARIKVTADLIDATIKAIEGAAVEIIEILYTSFTQRQVQQMKLPEPSSESTSDEQTTANWKKQYNISSGVQGQRARNDNSPGGIGQALTPGSKPVTLRAANIPSVQFGNVKVTKMEDMNSFLKKSQKMQKASAK